MQKLNHISTTEEAQALFMAYFKSPVLRKYASDIVLEYKELLNVDPSRIGGLHE